ncbi:hypothetical protein EJP617_19880 [Erwinia sp. Ejp617]|nr:hypothetical protein [Erwinia sp. Ejp617]ADP11669.1 hypothetical protein EJP617_19880 [Erwinia sp. Ejp617]
MKVSFFNKDIIEVYFNKITDGNISTKTFHRLLANIKDVKNIPQSIDKALNKKAEGRADLKLILSDFNLHRADGIYEFGIKNQDKIHKEQEKIAANFIEKSHKISEEMIDSSGIRFRLFVASELQRFKMDYDTPKTA